jgi:hypothetical protein
MIISAIGKNRNSLLGETSVRNVGNSTPWSILIDALDEDTEIVFDVYGFNTPYPSWEDGLLFTRMRLDYNITVKDQDKGGISITSGNFYPPITLSGTINVTYDNQPVPYLRIVAWAIDGDDYWKHVGDTSLESPGANTSWSIECSDRNTTVWFDVWAFDSYENFSGWDDTIFRWGFDWDDNNNRPIPYVTKTVNDQSISDIVLNLKNYITLSGTINVTYNGQPVPSVVIVALAADGDEEEAVGWNQTVIQNVGNNTPWSITMEGCDKDTNIMFFIEGNDDNGGELFFTLDGSDTITVKNQSVSGIVLNLGNMEPW